MEPTNFKHGDFTGLAGYYSQNRPGYSNSVLNALIGLVGKETRYIDFVDVGAGTGIWTRLVQSKGVRTAIAVEPNNDMRIAGMEASKSLPLVWRNGMADSTGLQDSCADWVTMASSFHWVDFDAATKEIYRILRDDGLFTALWNPRLIETNPILVEIEKFLYLLEPNLKRISSGRSGITETLTERLADSPYFEDVIFIEGRHEVKMTLDRYMGVWKSVNDLPVQLGIDKFNKFLQFVEQQLSGSGSICTTYLTRSWSARRSNIG